MNTPADEADAIRVHGLTVRQIDLLRKFYVEQTGDRTLVSLDGESKKGIPVNGTTAFPQSNSQEP
jgi:hypothetical protein